MALDKDSLQEIKSYMDARADHWKAEARNVSSSQISDEFSKRDERSSKRAQTIVTVAGVTIATLLGGTYLWINSFIETHANTRFDELKKEFVTNRQERLAELNQELSFLADQVKGVVDAKVAVGNAVAEAAKAVTEAKEKIEELTKLETEISERARTAESLIASAQNSNDRSSDLIAQVEKRLPALDAALSEVSSKLREVRALDSELVEVRELSDGIKRAEGDVVSAILANTDLQERLVAQASFPSGAVVSFNANDPGTRICPVGWRYFHEAENRFVLGADELKYQIGDVGGSETVTLTVNEMPKHNHGGETGPTGANIWYNTGDQNERWKAPVNGAVAISNAPTHMHKIENAGGSQPHNNMPPYIALYFCKKD